MGQYDDILTNYKPVPGADDHAAKIRGFMDAVVAALNSIYAAAVADGSISEDMLDIYNSPITKGFLSFNGTKFEWIGNITTGQIADKAITPAKLGTSNNTTGGVLQVPILQTDGTLKWESGIDKSLIEDGEIPYTKLKMIGTPLPGYFQKFDYDTAGQISLIAAPSANTEDSGMVKASEGAEYQWALDFLRDALPDEVPNYNNLQYVGKAQESSGGEFLYPPEMSFVGKIHDTSGELVEVTEALFFGKAQESSGGEFLYPPQMSFVGKIKETTGDLVYPSESAFYGRIKQTNGSALQLPYEYTRDYFKQSLNVLVFADTVAHTVGLCHSSVVMAGTTLANSRLSSVTANVYNGYVGAGWQTLTVQILRRRLSESLPGYVSGISCTRPGTPNANTTRVTYPAGYVSNTDASLRAGDWLVAFGWYSSGAFKLTSVGTNYFEYLDASSNPSASISAQSNVSFLKKMLSTEITLTQTLTSSNCVVYSESTRSVIAYGDIIIPEIVTIRNSGETGLFLTYNFNGMNIL